MPEIPAITRRIPIRKIMNAVNYHIIGILAILLSISSRISAEVTVTGKILTEGNRPVDMANVSARPANAPKRIIGSTITDEAGIFSLNLNSTSDSLILTVSSIEIETTSVTVPNRDGDYNIKTRKRTLDLKEVTVRPRKIYSIDDTINYNVTSYLSQTDRSVADVLKKMPGITVSDDGRISYKGKPIKKFYIEGLDLMKGRYEVATNNIDPNNISTVQVLENHQDIKALKGLRPEEQASINLKLKEGVKGVFNLVATLGAGTDEDFLWDESAIATYFKRTSQFLSTYKNNNSGHDLSQELHSFDDDFDRTSKLSDITLPSAPKIDKRFYYFNRSQSATYNNIYRLSKSGELGINAAYLRDHDSRRNSTHTANSLPDGTQNIVDEVLTGNSKLNKAYGDISYISNKDRSYLKEQLNFNWDNSSNHSSIFTREDIVQHGGAKHYRLNNKLHLTHRGESARGFEVVSMLNLERLPHELNVSPNLFPEVIPKNGLKQHVETRNFTTENQFSLLTGLMAGRIMIRPHAIFDYSHNSIKSSLSDFRNNLSLDNIGAGVGNEISFQNRKIYASLFLPLKYRMYRFDNRLLKCDYHKNRLRIEPKLSLKYKLNGNNDISLNSSLTYSAPQIENLYSNYILTSYRQLSAYDFTGLHEGLTGINSLSYNYRNILSMSFFGTDFTWTHQSPEVLNGAYYDGIAERLTSRATDEKANMFSARIRMSQGFDFWKMKVSGSASYSHVGSPLLIQDEIVRYQSNAIGAEISLNISPCRLIEMNYEGRYYQSSAKQNGVSSSPWMRSMSNTAKLTLSMSKKLSLTTFLYHYYNNQNERDRSFVLVNAEAQYALKRVMFLLTGDNLLNRKSYVYSNISALTETTSVYAIRQRSVMLKIRLRIF